LPRRAHELIPPADATAWHAVLLGAFLAFYAFIGFEDMVNVAEEAKDPVRDMPRAILLATVAATLLYVLVAFIAVLSLPPAELAASEAPLALLYARATGDPAVLISLIGIFAVVNGALIQIIMAARVLYGMSREGWIPAALGRVHRRTRTPLIATAAVAASVLVLALTIPLVELARATSFVILLVFVLVNLSLLRLKLRKVAPPPSAWRCPIWVPAAGAVVSLVLLAAQVRALT
jgi:amino acid transporter